MFLNVSIYFSLLIIITRKRYPKCKVKDTFWAAYIHFCIYKFKAQSNYNSLKIFTFLNYLSLLILNPVIKRRGRILNSKWVPYSVRRIVKPLYLHVFYVFVFTQIAALLGKMSEPFHLRKPSKKSVPRVDLANVMCDTKFRVTYSFIFI